MLEPAAPELPSSPALPPQLLAANLTPLHELPQRVAVGHGIGQDRNGPARRRRAIEAVKKVCTGSDVHPCPTPTDG